MDRRAFLSRMIPLATIAGGWVGLASLPGCARNGALSVGMHPWIGYESLRLADHFGWLPDAVRLVEGDNATATIAGLKAGSLEAGCLTLDEVLQLDADGMPMTVIGVLDISAGADVVLARPGISSLAQLAGKRIAYEQNAVGHLMLTKLLMAAGLDRGQIHLVALPPNEQLAPWQEGRIDVAISYAPWSGLLERLGAKRLFDSRQVPGSIIDVLAVRRDRLAWRRTALKGLLAAHFRAVDHLRINREDSVRRIAYWRRLNVDEVVHGLAGIELPDAVSNRMLLAPDGPLLAAAGELQQLMHDHGLLTRRMDLKALVDARYLPESSP